MVDIQKGESDELSKSVDTLLEGVMDGQIERFVMFYSKPHISKCVVMQYGKVAESATFA